MKFEKKPSEEITGCEEGTFDCFGMEGCYYCKENRCVYPVSQVQQPYARACNNKD